MTAVIRWLGNIATTVGVVAVVLGTIDLIARDDIIIFFKRLSLQPISFSLFILTCMAPGVVLLAWAEYWQKRKKMADFHHDNFHIGSSQDRAR
jgi:hypothetical protein